MPKKHQQRPAKEIRGRNKSERSTVITTGPYKKARTYEEQAHRHDNPGKLPLLAKAPPKRVIPPEVTTKEQDSRARMEEGERRSGSDSNARKGRKETRLHEKPERQPEPHPDRTNDFAEDLRPDNFAGANYSLLSEPLDIGLRASDIKELYPRLPGFTHAELRDLVIVPLGERLEQGARYIDLLHLERGEFVATAGMVADEDHYYVPKNHTDYVLWRRLKELSLAARLQDSQTGDGS